MEDKKKKISFFIVKEFKLVDGEWYSKEVKVNDLYEYISSTGRTKYEVRPVYDFGSNVTC